MDYQAQAQDLLNLFRQELEDAAVKIDEGQYKSARSMITKAIQTYSAEGLQVLKLANANRAKTTPTPVESELA